MAAYLMDGQGGLGVNQSSTVVHWMEVVKMTMQRAVSFGVRVSFYIHIWTTGEEREQKDDGMINGGDHHTLCNVDLNNTAM